MAEYANQVGKASATATSASGLDPVPATVGKQTLTAQLGDDASAARLASVKTREGSVVTDANHFVYVVTDAGGFEITQAPPPWERSVGAVVTIGRYAAVWTMLADLLETTSDKPTPSPPPKDEAPAVTMPVDDGADFWIATTTCKVKAETGANVSPVQVLPQFAHVRVLARKPFKDFTNAKIASIDPTGAIGAEIGWASLQHMIPVRRPKRPSTAAAQMAAVLAAARSVAGNTPGGLCYHNVKHHILAAGGYGDLLDIQLDERFVGFTAEALMFHAAVQKHGAAALGLEEVSGLPMSAQPGTLLVLRGTAKNNISKTAGDISVIEGMRGGTLIAYNDGTMPLLAKADDWATGTMAGSFVAMYRPIDRA